MRYVDVGALEDVPIGRSRLVLVDGVYILVCRTAGRVHATQGWCTHAGRPLDGADLDGGTLVCPHHGARFDAETGAALAAPASRALRVYPVRVNDGRIAIALK